MLYPCLPYVTVPSSAAVLTSGPDAITQSTGTATPIYAHFYLPDTPEKKLCQISCQSSLKLSADGNTVTVVTMKNLALHYSTEAYTVKRQNGKIYALQDSIMEQARLQPFMFLPTPTSV